MTGWMIWRPNARKRRMLPTKWKGRSANPQLALLLESRIGEIFEAIVTGASGKDIDMISTAFLLREHLNRY